MVKTYGFYKLKVRESKGKYVDTGMHVTAFYNDALTPEGLEKVKKDAMETFQNFHFRIRCSLRKPGTLNDKEVMFLDLHEFSSSFAEALGGFAMRNTYRTELGAGGQYPTYCCHVTLGNVSDEAECERNFLKLNGKDIFLGRKLFFKQIQPEKRLLGFAADGVFELTNKNKKN